MTPAAVVKRLAGEKLVILAKVAGRGWSRPCCRTRFHQIRRITTSRLDPAAGVCDLEQYVSPPVRWAAASAEERTKPLKCGREDLNLHPLARTGT